MSRILNKIENYIYAVLKFYKDGYNLGYHYITPIIVDYDIK